MTYYTPQEEDELNVINNIQDKEKRKQQMRLFAQKTNRNFDAVNSKLHYMNNEAKKKKSKTIVQKPEENTLVNTLRLPIDKTKIVIENGYITLTFKTL